MGTALSLTPMQSPPQDEQKPAIHTEPCSPEPGPAQSCCGHPETHRHAHQLTSHRRHGDPGLSHSTPVATANRDATSSLRGLVGKPASPT